MINIRLLEFKLDSFLSKYKLNSIKNKTILATAILLHESVFDITIDNISQYTSKFFNIDILKTDSTKLMESLKII